VHNEDTATKGRVLVALINSEPALFMGSVGGDTSLVVRGEARQLSPLEFSPRPVTLLTHRRCRAGRRL
jgi:hypothetical protein